MKEALLYDKLDSGKVKCRLCRHGCTIDDGKKGVCRVRMNRDGTLYSLVFDKVISSNVDPIEKKPLFHVAPGSRAYSIATVGCNFRCSFCQNHSISQMPRDRGVIMGDDIPPSLIASAASQAGCGSVSYTYTEPTVYYELAKETMVEAKKLGLLNAFVTNGYMTREMLDDAKGLLDAANVDLKAFNDAFYKDYCHGKREGVLDTLRYMKELGIWVEVTTLLIPTLNDDPAEVRDLARFIKDELGPETPWHVSRFHPQYRERSLPPTEERAVREVREIGREEGLYYVYTGNLPGDAGEKTYCPKCSHLLIDRMGYRIWKNVIQEGKCPKCGHRVEGIEM
jgi:pyruvate formate lyase activating enzyme